ncbi:hypothetical protein Tco_1207689, partial [Tanacetum coccineum]
MSGFWLKLLKLYMARKVALKTIVVSIMNWSRPNLGIKSAKIEEVEDTCVWLLGTDGTVSIKDARYIIDSKILQYLAPSTIWDKNIPQKAISYPSCNGNVESSNHIFFECNIAKDIWMLVHKWYDISFLLLLCMSIEKVGLLRG